MFLTELTELRLLVIYPGRFQPWHKGHYAVYEHLTGKFGRNNVFVATSNKLDPPRSPFNFTEKQYFMMLTGVPNDRIVESSQPYVIDQLLRNPLLSSVDKANTVAIFAVSAKDMAEDPRFSFGSKKDGSPSYFQPFKDIRQCQRADQHAYIMTVPTFDFKILGQPMRSGTELRSLYTQSDEQRRKVAVKELFGRYTPEAQQIMDSKLGANAVKEDAAGVGVVRNTKDPRYVMAVTGDQNAVNGETLGKEMQAFFPTRSPKTGQKTVKRSVGKG